MTYATKHFSAAKMDRWEKRHILSDKRARISSKRFNKAERKAVKLHLEEMINESTT